MPVSSQDAILTADGPELVSCDRCTVRSACTSDSSPAAATRSAKAPRRGVGAFAERPLLPPRLLPGVPRAVPQRLSQPAVAREARPPEPTPPGAAARAGPTSVAWRRRTASRWSPVQITRTPVAVAWPSRVAEVAARPRRRAGRRPASSRVSGSGTGSLPGEAGGEAVVPAVRPVAGARAAPGARPRGRRRRAVALPQVEHRVGGQAHARRRRSPASVTSASGTGLAPRSAR